MSALPQLCDDIGRYRSALFYLDPNMPRSEWFKAACGFKDAGGSLEDFDNWSSDGENYEGNTRVGSMWRSINLGGYTAASLIAMAKEAGWKGEAKYQKPSAAEIAARDAERSQRREEEVKAKAERQAKAAERAAKIWSGAEPANEHIYLSRKGVKAHGLRIGKWEVVDRESGEVYTIEGALLIQMRDIGKKIHSLQAIFPSNDNVLGVDRVYLPGGAKQGHFHPIGQPLLVEGKKVIVIVEGYATGASIHECTGHAVVVAFDASNLEPVARVIREHVPGADIVIFSDRDAESLNESVGTKLALKAALSAEARIVVPEWTGKKGRDANDIHLEGFTWSGTTYPGKDILAGCVNFATPYRSPAFMEMLRECGIEANDLVQALAGTPTSDGDRQWDADEVVAVPHKVPPVALGRAAGATEDAPAEILLEAGELPHIVDLAETVLNARAPHLYTRGGRIVRPIKVPTVITGGKRADITQVKPIAVHALAEDLTRACAWLKADARRRKDGSRVRVNCPLVVAKTLMDRDQWSLRPLTAIIHGPTLRADGTVLEAPGYDEETGLLLEPHMTFAPVPHTPSREDALVALARLDDLVCKFPFVTPSDKSVWVAGLLTAAIRRSLLTAPMFAFTAPTAGSGKSYLADLIATIVTGEAAPALSQGRNEEETEKRLTGILLSGHTLVNLDNCTLAVEGDFLCQVLTQPVVEVRRMGGHDVCRVPGSSTMLATGNSLVIAGDMTRRALLCTLDAGVERPELREFAFNPIDKAKAGRAGYLVDALTILRAFHVVGRPRQVRPLGSFEDWSDWVRGALIWLGMADPCATMERTRKSDPKLSSLREILHGLHNAFGERKVRAREIIEKAMTHTPFSQGSSPGPKDYENPDLREALLAAAGAGGAINSKALGKWLSSNQGRPVDRLRLVEAGEDRDGVKLWAVCSNEPPL